MKMISRSKRIVIRKTPGGRIAVHYENRRPNIAKCAICKSNLRGVPNLPSVKMRNIPKSSKRPNRPYGGYIDHKCLEKLIKKAVREEVH
ncbi:MAG: 50S ribosomal protein L34e [Candidatus Methanomethylicia archaeon]